MKRWISVILAVLLGCGMLGGCLFFNEGTAPAPASVSEPLSQADAGSSTAEDSPSLPQTPSEVGEAPGSIKLVVPEGYTLARIGITLEELGVVEDDQAFVDACQNGDWSSFPLIAAQTPNEHRCFTLEGYLFPATYEFPEDVAVEEIIRSLLNTTESRLAGVMAEIEQSGYSVDEILTLASIIEKESFGEAAMAGVSSVYHNRLDIDMQLQSDPTIKYVEGAIKPYITGDVDRYNEYYNTYKCPALPAGPICNPGMAAINAALHPAQTPYLYFISDADNNFHYAETFEEHEANIAEYL